jgi:acetoin utilization deacetylase AcuC-like enzyme
MLPLVYHKNYSCVFAEDHRFVMSKFRRLHDILLKRGLIDADHANVFTPVMGNPEDFAIAHSPNYLKNLLGNHIYPKEWRRVGLPWSQGLVDRTLTAPNGTLLTARLALQYGVACHLAGGTHHAHRDFGSGFCMINDLAYTALKMLETKELSRILIFDCDVHQGDGSATILSGKPGVFTCSIHCEKNFPFRKAQSDLDVGLAFNMEDNDYIDIVDSTLQKLLIQFQPDLVLYDAGVDVWEHDELGKLNISWKGIEDRDRLVIETCFKQGIPIATVIGGGYEKDHERLAQRHAIVIEQAHAVINK